MINIGLVRRAVREIMLTTLLCAGMLATISGLLAYALPQVQERAMRRNGIPPFLMQVRNALLGVDSSGASVAEIAFSIAWSHPVMLILLLAHGVIVCTRVPAGEIERGSIDMLMGLPISRVQLFFSEMAAWLIGGFILLAAVYGGSYFGAQFIPARNRPNWGLLAIVLANLGLVYAVASGAAAFASSLSDRRGRAILAVLFVLVASLLVQFLELLWDPARDMAWISFFHYHRPMIVLKDKQWPSQDIAILGGIAVVLWVGAAVVMKRRGLTTL